MDHGDVLADGDKVHLFLHREQLSAKQYWELTQRSGTAMLRLHILEGRKDWDFCCSNPRLAAPEIFYSTKQEFLSTDGIVSPFAVMTAAQSEGDKEGLLRLVSDDLYTSDLDLKAATRAIEQLPRLHISFHKMPASGYCDKISKAILLNEKHSRLHPTEMEITLFHELYHLVEEEDLNKTHRLSKHLPSLHLAEYFAVRVRDEMPEWAAKYRPRLRIMREQHAIGCTEFRLDLASGEVSTKPSHPDAGDLLQQGLCEP
jgi:hypothetical protein